MRKMSAFLLALCVLLHGAVLSHAAGGNADLAVVDPGSVGMSGERLGRIESIWQREIANKSFPGGVTLIARDGKVVYHQAVGHMDAKQTKPMPVNAVFNIASMTKPVVSVATMMLVEQGVLKLNDPISKYLPEFVDKDMKVEVVKKDAEGKTTSELVPAKRAITIQDLLRHTSGFTYAGRTAPPLVKKGYDEANIEARAEPLSSEEMIKRLAKLPLVYQPGTVFNYGVSTDVLGLLLERVLNKKLDAILKEMVLDPLGMTETSFALTPERKARQPEFFDTEPGKASQVRQIELNGGDGTTYFKGGAGLMSTVGDYFKFATMLLNCGELNGVRLLSPATVAFMTSDHLEGMGPEAYKLGSNNGPGYGFGLGFAVRVNKGVSWFLGSVGDYNWGGGRGHYFFVDPTEKIVGIFMSYGPTARAHTRQVFKNFTYAAVEKQYGN